MNNLQTKLAINCPVDRVVEEKLSILEESTVTNAMAAALSGRKAGLPKIPLLSTAIVAVALASGCTSLKNSTMGAAESETAPVLRQPIDSAGQPADNTIRHDTSNSRVAQLWAEAELSRMAGDNAAASRYILQAIEVEPTDSVLLSRAAELQLQMGQPALAESYAVRSNTLSQSNRSLMLRNWMIIEHSREVRGDLLGVRTAHRMVQQFSN